MEHLNGFSAVNLDAEAATVALQENLRQFGPVRRSSFASFREALDYLIPLKSFTTRYLVLGQAEWSIVLTDMRGENCYVEAYAISRATFRNAMGLFLHQERREFQLFENGQKVREIQSLWDGDRWYYREEGSLQPFEDPQECLRRKKQERLSVQALRRYFQIYTGQIVPDWINSNFTPIFGLERSTKDLRVQLCEFETEQDLWPQNS